MALRSLIAALLALSPAAARTITHDFSVGWVLANPDGAFDKPTIGVNGQWPPPLIAAAVGDRVVVHLRNDLGNASTSLHFHGLFQNGTNHMDGAVGVTQCAIPPGSSFTYSFVVNQPGTYWYHAHNDGQYPDGLRGPLVVHDPAGPHEGKYDEELILTVSDWYHQPMKSLIKRFINYKNPSGAEPIPHAALMNDTRDLKVHVKPATTYLVRMVNVAAFAAQYVKFEGHQVRVVEVDGVWTEESEPVDVLYIAAAQRYSVLLTTKPDASENFAVVGAMDRELFDDLPEDLDTTVTGWLVYDDKKHLPEPATTEFEDSDALDDIDLAPFDAHGLMERPDTSIEFNVKMDILGNGANYAFFNDVTYVAPKVPSLYTAYTVGGASNATNPLVYGSYTNAHVLAHNDVVELVVNNADDGDHPFHLHGHNFQVVARSAADAGPYVPGLSKIHSTGKAPMRRDTVLVRGNGHAVLRFRADNPGVWLFHCHIEWHMDQGLVATMVAAPDALLSGSSGYIAPPVPKSHLEACRRGGVQFVGNAAGNFEDVLDLTGERRPPAPLPEGFTTKGYIAMVCSCLAAFMGLASIYYYGNMPDETQREEQVE